MPQIHESLRAPARGLQLGMLALTCLSCGLELVIGELQRRLTLVEGVPCFKVSNFDATQMGDVFLPPFEFGGECDVVSCQAPD